jgi:hypothetical protein
MLVSSEKKFLFVHIPKTAGSSITNVLRPFSHPQNRTLRRRVTSHLPIREAQDAAYFRVHDRAHWARIKLGRTTYDELHSFAVVRNPFDLAASHYRFLQERTPERYGKRGANWSFLDLLQYLRRARRRFDQTSWVTDRSGAIIVDRIMRFETLPQDFSELALDLGLPSTVLPKVNTTQGRDLETNFTNEAIKEIQAIYAPDFERFGYPADGPPQ